LSSGHWKREAVLFQKLFKGERIYPKEGKENIYAVFLPSFGETARGVYYTIY
jgi:hypothetical protein